MLDEKGSLVKEKLKKITSCVINVHFDSFSSFAELAGIFFSISSNANGCPSVFQVIMYMNP